MQKGNTNSTSEELCYQGPVKANWEIGSWNIINYKYEMPHQCAIHECRNTWYYGDGDVRWFRGIGTVCAVHGYLIPNMTQVELSNYAKLNNDERFTDYWINDYPKGVENIPTVLYTNKGRRLEFFTIRQELEISAWFCPNCEEFYTR
jgi:hypothetical protein